MEVSSFEFFLIFLSSFFLVSGLTPIMRKIAIARNLIDQPNSGHKTHVIGVPYLGGVAIVLGIVLVTYFSILFSSFSQITFGLASSVLFPATFLSLIGLIDDIKNLSPWSRFIAQSVAAMVTAFILISTNNFGNPTGSKFFDAILTIFWIVGICNSLNFFDNLDGGAATTLVITSIGLTILALGSKQVLVGAMSTTLMGAMLGFLVWNKNPAKIYMGDAGSLFLGFLVSVLAIRLHPSSNSQIGSYSIPVLILAIPILDTLVVVFSRLRSGKSPFVGGQDHLAHRLLRIGWSKNITVLILSTFSALFCLIGILISLSTYNEKMLILFASVIYFLLFLGFLSLDKNLSQ